MTCIREEEDHRRVILMQKMQNTPYPCASILTPPILKFCLRYCISASDQMHCASKCTVHLIKCGTLNQISVNNDDTCTGFSQCDDLDQMHLTCVMHICDISCQWPVIHVLHVFLCSDAMQPLHACRIQVCAVAAYSMHACLSIELPSVVIIDSHDVFLQSL